MKHIKWFLFLFIAGAVASCGLSSDRGELVGSPGRKAWFHPQPYGTVYVPTSSLADSALIVGGMVALFFL
jgi:hypothetical protein